jgi:putative endonuclease
MNPVRNSQWYTYVVQSKKDGLFYSGCTNNLNNRIKDHKNGKVLSTKHRLPIKLVYYEVCLNRKDAYQREKYFKSGMGRRYIKNRLKNYLTKG